MNLRTNDVRHEGLPLTEAEKALVMLHGRGGSADDIMSLLPHLRLDGFAVLVPQARDHAWYPFSFLRPKLENEPWLSAALHGLLEMVEDLGRQGIGRENVYFLGFSQGACLALEFVANQSVRYGGIVAFAGGLIGDRISEEDYQGDLMQTPVLIATSDPDPYIPVERARISADVLAKRKANVTFELYKGLGHTISMEEIEKANQLIFAS